jgi:putative transposase
MSQTVSPSTSRSYGLARVSRAWSISRASVYRLLNRTPSLAIARRPGPTGACPDADLADHIRREIEASNFHGEGYRKISARLRIAGVRSSPRRVRRVTGENGLLALHHQKSSAFTPRVQPIVSRHWSRSGGEVRRCFGSIAPGVARGLKLRHDHGSNYMSGDFQDEIKCLGIEASPSFVREPEGNGVAERLIRALKKNLLWVRTFNTIEELRAELLAFARHYNENLARRAAWIQSARDGQRGANPATN